MKHTVRIIFIAALLNGVLSIMALADEPIFETFDHNASQRWSYFTDGVMGGVSEGRAGFGQDSDRNFIRIQGRVSTQNNGGFLQVRRTLPQGLPAGTERLVLTTRGNGDTYYVFLRTTQMLLPWHIYTAPFTAPATWSTATISLSDFKASHDFLKTSIDPQTITSIGLVAYGKDYDADFSVARIEIE